MSAPARSPPATADAVVHQFGATVRADHPERRHLALANPRWEFDEHLTAIVKGAQRPPCRIVAFDPIPEIERADIDAGSDRRSVIGGDVLPAQRDELVFDGLANLPRDYTGLPHNAPQLGPPLPGDLGRPMVNAGMTAPGMPQPATGPSPEEQRIAQEQEAARTSHLFTTTSGGQTAAAVLPAAAVPGMVPNAAGSPGLTSQDHKLAFLNGDVDRRTVSPDRVEAPASTNILQAGAVIAASLLTGLRSDLPGQVTAQVTENVYDSPTGRILLIPQGARLVGQYDAQVAFGQSRALLVWNRLIMPNGRSIILERQPGADPDGYAGLEDQVDNHWGMLFKAAILSTLLSVGSEAGTSDNENSLVQAIRQGTSQSFSQVGQQVVGRSLNVHPTITIRPGFPVRVLVTHDLVLEPYRR